MRFFLNYFYVFYSENISLCVEKYRNSLKIFVQNVRQIYSSQYIHGMTTLFAEFIYKN